MWEGVVVRKGWAGAERRERCQRSQQCQCVQYIYGYDVGPRNR